MSRPKREKPLRLYLIARKLLADRKISRGSGVPPCLGHAGDVAFFYAIGSFAGLCPGYYSTCPDLRYRWYTLNGYRHRLIWGEPLG